MASVRGILHDAKEKRTTIHMESWSMHNQVETYAFLQDLKLALAQQNFFMLL
jgi:hypothetical protein